jgi:hypothetical protein
MKKYKTCQSTGQHHHVSRHASQQDMPVNWAAPSCFMFVSVLHAMVCKLDALVLSFGFTTDMPIVFIV